MDNLQQYKVKISDHNERVSRFDVKAFRFEGQDSWQSLPKKDMPRGKIPLLLCLCGSGEFTTNGRFLSEYECPCCGGFVELEFINQSPK